MSHTVALSPWGHSLAVRLPKELLKVAGITSTATFEATYANGAITLTPKKLTLEERLASFDPAVHGGEVMAYAPTGAEVGATD